MKQRDYDWGNVTEEQQKQNQLSLLNEGTVIGRYKIPDDCCLGSGYPDEIIVKTIQSGDGYVNVTIASFPDEEDF